MAAGVAKDTVQNGIVVGDSLTGETLATFAPPANTIFESVTAAADDRTFVVFAVASSTVIRPVYQGGNADRQLVRDEACPRHRAAGPADPAAHQAVVVGPRALRARLLHTVSRGGLRHGVVQAGKELAVAESPGTRGRLDTAQNWQEVKVFSVATGRLLHDWTENDSSGRVTATRDWWVPSLTWIDGDRALALATAHTALRAGTQTGTMRRLNVAGPAAVTWWRTARSSGPGS